MASKVVALLVVCLVFFAAVQIPQASAETWDACMPDCEEKCKAAGNGQTFCEMKCDTDCFDKEINAKLKAAP
ncbi:hypothetical protein Tsubulata_049703 [Turnera subulata]|uniref:Uncharacterized protein n=1 Tax=Turnera subulata TaxID=218843 RepID=A0A9Q0G6Q2_9ROSI|nr:hypothetical protein Tsubulata_049703 [Turnera subulata]